MKDGMNRLGLGITLFAMATLFAASTASAAPAYQGLHRKLPAKITLQTNSSVTEEARLAPTMEDAFANITASFTHSTQGYALPELNSDYWCDGRQCTALLTGSFDFPLANPEIPVTVNGLQVRAIRPQEDIMTATISGVAPPRRTYRFTEEIDFDRVGVYNTKLTLNIGRGISVIMEVQADVQPVAYVNSICPRGDGTYTMGISLFPYGGPVPQVLSTYFGSGNTASIGGNALLVYTERDGTYAQYERVLSASEYQALQSLLAQTVNGNPAYVYLAIQGGWFATSAPVNEATFGCEKG